MIFWLTHDPSLSNESIVFDKCFVDVKNSMLTKLETNNLL